LKIKVLLSENNVIQMTNAKSPDSLTHPVLQKLLAAFSQAARSVATVRKLPSKVIFPELFLAGHPCMPYSDQSI
jgi:hypothetical protein